MKILKKTWALALNCVASLATIFLIGFCWQLIVELFCSGASLVKWLFSFIL